MLASIGRWWTKFGRFLVSEFGEWSGVLREAQTLARDASTYLHEHAADPKAQALINRFTALAAKLERLIPND